MNEHELLARIIKCEAGGEGDAGMRAVASVIMNRVHLREGEYGRYNSPRDVIFAARQFECVSHPTQNIYNIAPEPVHYDIADWALSGGRLGAVGNSLWFFNPYSDVCPANFPSGVGYFYTRIGDHCFYAPTSDYYLT